VVRPGGGLKPGVKRIKKRSLLEELLIYNQAKGTGENKKIWRTKIDDKKKGGDGGKSLGFRGGGL